MATDLQQRAVDKIVEMSRNPSLRKTKGEALLEAGYKKATAIKPSQVLESKGFKEILKKNGLTPNLITKALVADIKSKPGKRLGEMSLGADILKMKESDKGTNNNIIINVIKVIAEQNDIQTENK